MSAGPGLGTIYPLAGESLRLGRTDQPKSGFEGWLFLDDNSVSRFHAELVWDEGENSYILFHRSQTNPTWVNQEQVHQHRLQIGDQVKLGNVSLVVEMVPSLPSRETTHMVNQGETDFVLVDSRSEETRPLNRPTTILQLDCAVAFQWMEHEHSFQMSRADQESADIFLTRKMDGATWSTELRLDGSVIVRAGDIIRVGSSRFIMTRAQ